MTHLHPQHRTYSTSANSVQTFPSSFLNDSLQQGSDGISHCNNSSRCTPGLGQDLRINQRALRDPGQFSSPNICTSRPIIKCLLPIKEIEKNLPRQFFSPLSRMAARNDGIRAM
ncbi:hypothetical protein NPIL_593791 [Nephila pilipes]|uniref:Uncharacterized protein n=1 Tax=Nephila pilipes TaxID=299642 RepID=A0A8X6TKI9_NEPPI|nr:hypothetical protein NPIL_593791 [Nephila pilipes]